MFGKDVNNLFFGINILQLDIFLNNLFSTKMILDWNILCFLLHDGISWDIYFTSIVVENKNGFIIFHFDVR